MKRQVDQAFEDLRARYYSETGDYSGDVSPLPPGYSWVNMDEVDFDGLGDYEFKHCWKRKSVRNFISFIMCAI
jgi:hypothetical protein